MTEKPFVCHVCKKSDVPVTQHWITEGKDICSKCLMRSTIKNMDGSEIKWDINGDKVEVKK